MAKNILMDLAFENFHICNRCIAICSSVWME